MIVGVPKEIKPDEGRVALVPSGVAAFVAHGHKVLIERGAGAGSGIHDADYRRAGAQIVKAPAKLWERADLIVKVKEPLDDELSWMRPGQVLYTYLHLASDQGLTEALIERGVIAIGYETIQLDDGSLPLLVPMSEIAGRLAVQKGAQCLEAGVRGRGILLSGVSGVKPANVLVLGAGVAGSNACHIAAGMGARVTVMDINPARLRYLQDIFGGRLTTVMSNRANIEEEVADADLVIGAVLIPGARAPHLVSKALIRRMRPGSVVVDVCIDQGGCFATSKPTTHHDPVYHVDNVVHYCVSNMPGAVPRTSTYALTNVTLSYGLALADNGVDTTVRNDPALARGVNVYRGHLTHAAVAETFRKTYTPIDDMLG